MELSCDDFVLDTPEALSEVWAALSRRRPCRDIRKLLSVSGQRRFDGYYTMHATRAAMSPAFCADLSQDPGVRPICGGTFKTSRRGSIWYSFSKSHLYTPAEMQFAHGWPSLSAFIEEGGPQSPYDFGQLGWRKQRSLLGNGMHLACMGAFYGYCLSQLRRRDTWKGRRQRGPAAAQRAYALWMAGRATIRPWKALTRASPGARGREASAQGAHGACGRLPQEAAPPLEFARGVGHAAVTAG